MSNDAVITVMRNITTPPQPHIFSGLICLWTLQHQPLCPETDSKSGHQISISITFLHWCWYGHMHVNKKRCVFAFLITCRLGTSYPTFEYNTTPRFVTIICSVHFLAFKSSRAITQDSFILVFQNSVTISERQRYRGTLCTTRFTLLHTWLYFILKGILIGSRTK